MNEKIERNNAIFTIRIFFKMSALETQNVHHAIVGVAVD